MVRETVKIGGREVVLIAKPYDEDDVNVDKILTIDYENLACEFLTFSVLMNRLGIMRADSEHFVQEAELDFLIWKSKKTLELKKKFQEEIDDSSHWRKKFSEKDIEASYRTSPVYKSKKKNLLRKIKFSKHIDSIYWSAKDKADRLREIKVQKIDFDINLFPPSFNGVEIRIKKEY